MKPTEFVILVAFCSNCILIGSKMSLLPQLFPMEAQSKGATASQYGPVFGATSLASLLVTPIYGRYGSRVGLKLLCLAGSVALGICPIIFGSLMFIQDAKVFIGLSYTVQFIEGLGLAALDSSMFAILMAMLPDKAAVIPAFQGVSIGIGFIIGPPIGTVLYSWSGYTLPFYLSGTMILIVSVILFLTIPSVKQPSPGEVSTLETKSDGKLTSAESEELLNEDCETKTLTYRSVFKNTTLLIPMTVVIAAKASATTIESMLEGHMINSAAQASQPQVAAALSMMGASGLTASTLGSYISDKLVDPNIVSIGMEAVTVIAYGFVGPAPYVPLATTVPLIDVAVVFIAIGNNVVTLSSYGTMSRAAKRLGFSRNGSTHIMLAGLYLGCAQLGSFLGSTFSGLVVDALGFPSMTVCFQVLMVTVFLADTSTFLYFRSKYRKQNGFVPIPTE